MKKHYLFLIAVYFFLAGNSNAQSPNYLWAKSAGGIDYDYGKSCCTDAGGNIIVTGVFGSSTITFGTTVLINAGLYNIFIVKYDSGGNVLWAKSAGGTDNDNSYSCCTDASGNIIVTGSFKSPTITFGTTVLINTNGGSADMFIVKYDPNGNVLWANSGGGAGNDYSYSCCTDSGGNIIVTGVFGSSTIAFGTTVLINAGTYNIFIVKCDPGGNVLWAKSAGGTAFDIGNSCSTDAGGNIIVTGSFQNTITLGTTVLTCSGGSNMFIVKYDPNGNALWAKSAGGNYSDFGKSCCTDAGGNIIAAGYFSSQTITFGFNILTNHYVGSDDMFIVKYNPGGNVLWAKCVGGTSSDEGYSCCADASGNIIATGAFYSPTITLGTTVLTNAGSDDIFIVKYSPNGNMLWAKSAGGTSNDDGYSCSTDAGGNIIITGYFYSPTINFGTTVLTKVGFGYNDMFIVKLGSISTAEVVAANVSTGVSIFPNPVKDELIISNSMFEENKNAQLKIVDVYGKEILSQQVLSKNTKVNTTYLLQGIYFVKVTTDVGSVVKKFIRQ